MQTRTIDEAYAEYLSYSWSRQELQALSVDEFLDQYHHVSTLHYVTPIRRMLTCAEVRMRNYMEYIIRLYNCVYDDRYQEISEHRNEGEF